jgi:hypothetical protein
MKIFEIQPASNSSLFIIIPVSLVVIGVLILLIFAFVASKNSKFIIDENTLRIEASFYSRTIPLNEIIRKEIKLLNLGNKSEWDPALRSNGIGLFGYSEGWFRLRNGSKGLLFLTRKNDVALIPTVNKYFIMASPKNPKEFIQAMQE